MFKNVLRCLIFLRLSWSPLASNNTTRLWDRYAVQNSSKEHLEMRSLYSSPSTASSKICRVAQNPKVRYRSLLELGFGSHPLRSSVYMKNDIRFPSGIRSRGFFDLSAALRYRLGPATAPHVCFRKYGDCRGTTGSIGLDMLLVSSHKWL